MQARLLRLIGALLGCGLLLTPTASASSAPAPDDGPPPPLPAAGSPWFGVTLDWANDLPADYAERLGETPSLYSQNVDYPLGEDQTTYLRQFAEQSATQGAVAALTLEPTVPLTELTVEDAREVADLLRELHVELDSFFLVRFAPEMNGSWKAWGQQPTAYVEAFRTVADEVHAATSQAEMVWSPVYGSGYPFGRAYGALDLSPDREGAQLDTDGDGDVDDADDPYGPYFPGDDVVDWVGLTLYHFGAEYDAPSFDTDDDVGPDAEQDPTAFSINSRPRPDELQSRLAETWGYGDESSREPFYERFAVDGDRPMLMETGALWTPEEADGDSETEIKRTWWRQVFASLDAHPLVRGISWLETSRPEAEADNLDVQWGATRTEALAASLRRDLDSAGITMGPVTRVLDQEAGNIATTQGRAPAAEDIGDEMGWIVFCASLLAVAFVAAGLVGRFVPSWRYPDEHDPRDRRLDLFRGWIILTVVLTHIELASPYSFISLRAIGAITGAEMFVLLSGVVLGMIYAPTVAKLGEWATAVTMWRRARKQYVVAIAVVLLVFLIGLVPFVDATDITTFTDRGTGADGTAVQGQVYDLYANAPRLFDYPPPWYAVKALLLLEMGPWVFNIMGLFVVLSLALPALMWLIRRRLWWLVLAGSWALYVWASVDDVRVLPSQFEDVFPLLIWQIAFTHGLVLGYYRTAITRALTTRVGKIACAVFVLGYAGSLVYIWATFHLGVSPLPFPDSSYTWLYANGYTRIDLQAGRLIDLALMVVVAFAFLTTCWKPVDKVIGWFWIPLGQASLYVFIVHVFFALAVGNIPGLDRTNVWQGTVIHTAVILLIWLMVKKKVLFSVIPR